MLVSVVVVVVVVVVVHWNYGDTGVPGHARWCQIARPITHVLVA
jgi:hypothetical protein